MLTFRKIKRRFPYLSMVEFEVIFVALFLMFQVLTPTLSPSAFSFFFYRGARDREQISEFDQKY